MKNITLTICLVLIAGTFSLFTSCSKSNITFDMPITLNKFTYGPGLGERWHYNSQSVGSTLDSLVTANGGNIANLKSIFPKSLKVTAISPTNFNQFSYADSWIKTGTDSVKLFYLNPIPTDSTTITFGVDDTDISSFVKSSAFTVSLEAFNVQDIATNDTLSATMIFTVTLGPGK